MSVQDNVRAEVYKNQLDYPAKSYFQQIFVYSKGKVLVNGVPRNSMTDDQIKGHRVAGNNVEIVDDGIAFKAARVAYGVETSRLEKLFREDLEKENDMVGHPKADLLFSKAWQMGHSNGLGEVAIYYDDLVDLVK